MGMVRLLPFGLGVVGVSGGACVKYPSCLSFKVERTQQVRAHCGTSFALLRLGRTELHFDRWPFKDSSALMLQTSSSDSTATGFAPLS